MAPIHFLPPPRLLPIPWGLRAHTHAIPILVDRTLTLPLLAIFPLIIFPLACTIFAHRIPGSLPLCPFHHTSTHPIILWTPYLTIGPWRCHPLPLPHSWSVTQFPVTTTIASVCDSASPLPLPYYRSLTQFPFCLLISVLLLMAWSVLGFPTYINPVYHSCIPQLESTWFYMVN